MMDEDGTSPSEITTAIQTPVDSTGQSTAMKIGVSSGTVRKRRRGKRTTSKAKAEKKREKKIAEAKASTKEKEEGEEVELNGKYVKVKWRGHAENTPFTLPASKSLLRENALDAEVEPNVLGVLGLKGREKRGEVLQETRETNWGALESLLKERSEERPKPSKSAVTLSWWEMPRVELTEEQRRDLRVIENRQHLDPKRFYKGSGTGRKRGELPDRVQFGTVVECAHEWYSGRLTRRERRATITEQALSDPRVREFTKRKNREIQKHATRPRRVIDPAASKKRR